MADLVNGLAIRRRLGRRDWGPPRSYGPDGFVYRSTVPHAGAVIVSGWYEGNEGWIHASISRPDHIPSYEDLTMLHRAVWEGDGFAYQVFAPVREHVNIHERCLHLFGLADGSRVLPNFAPFGTI